MGKLEVLEREVATLDTEELARFRDWFAQFDAADWDRKFEKDVAAGKLDELARQALADHAAGRIRPL